MTSTAITGYTANQSHERVPTLTSAIFTLVAVIATELLIHAEGRERDIFQYTKTDLAAYGA